jgi:hypothetical protein
MKCHPGYKDPATKSLVTKGHPGYKDLATKSLVTKGHPGYKDLAMKSLGSKGHPGYGIWQRKVCRLFVARSLYPMATKGHPGFNRSGTNGLATIRLAGKFGCKSTEIINISILLYSILIMIFLSDGIREPFICIIQLTGGFSSVTAFNILHLYVVVCGKALLLMKNIFSNICMFSCVFISFYC